MSIAFLYYYTFRLARGVETLVTSLANALVRRGEAVALVTARPTLTPLVAPDPRVRVHAYLTSRYFEHTLIAPLFAGHFLRHHYDTVVVFYADFGEGQAWQLLQRLGVSLPLALYLCSPYSAVPHRYQSMARLGWGRTARHILADAEWVAAEAAEFFQRPVPVVPIGTDPQRFRPLPEVRAAARARWGYAADDVILLNVSALEARKGTRRAILALARLRDRYPQLRYLILGHGDQEPSLRTLTHELGLDDRVIFAGESPRLEEFYNLADVFVMLPDDEANSIACHEAMSCGLPVVAANRGGFRESVPPGAGLLVDPDCAEAVDAALAQLIESPALRAQLGAAGRASILAHHTWDQVAARFLEVVTCPSPS